MAYLIFFFFLGGGGLGSCSPTKRNPEFSGRMRRLGPYQSRENILAVKNDRKYLSDYRLFLPLWGEFRLERNFCLILSLTTFVACDVPKLLSKCSVVVLLQMMTCWTRGFPRACSLSPYLVGQKRSVVCLLSEIVRVSLPRQSATIFLCCVVSVLLGEIPTGENPGCVLSLIFSEKPELKEVRNAES